MSAQKLNLTPTATGYTAKLPERKPSLARAIYILVSVVVRVAVLLWAALATDGALSVALWVVFTHEVGGFLVGAGIGAERSRKR